MSPDLDDAFTAHMDTVHPTSRTVTEWDLWSDIGILTAWLDASNGRSDEELTLRILKLSEEVGEVAEALIGMRGQNPRKGVTHTSDDVAGELCDVIVTAMVALNTLTGDPKVSRAYLASKMTRLLARAEETP